MRIDGLEYTISNNKEEFSVKQKTLMSRTIPKTYIHIEHIKVRSTGDKMYEMLKDVTFIVK